MLCLKVAANFLWAVGLSPKNANNIIERAQHLACESLDNAARGCCPPQGQLANGRAVENRELKLKLTLTAIIIISLIIIRHRINLHSTLGISQGISATIKDAQGEQ